MVEMLPSPDWLALMSFPSSASPGAGLIVLVLDEPFWASVIELPAEIPAPLPCVIVLAFRVPS